MRRCIFRKQLDLDTLVCTRGPNFPLSRLESRLMCPACGSHSITVVFEPPTGRLGTDDREVRMASMTYYVALAFTRSEGGDVVACEPKEAAVRNKRSAWPTRWRRRKGIAEPSHVEEFKKSPKDNRHG
jgi:hypothetical protein